jgi:hypothetical protein
MGRLRRRGSYRGTDGLLTLASVPAGRCHSSREAHPTIDLLSKVVNEVSRGRSPFRPTFLGSSALL